MGGTIVWHLFCVRKRQHDEAAEEEEEEEEHRRGPLVVDLFHWLCLRRFLILYLAPLPRGVPGEGPECHILQELGSLGPIPARIRGVMDL